MNRYREIFDELYALYQTRTLERSEYERLRAEAATALSGLVPEERADLLGDLDSYVPLEWSAQHNGLTRIMLERSRTSAVR